MIKRKLKLWAALVPLMAHLIRTHAWMFYTSWRITVRRTKAEQILAKR